MKPKITYLTSFLAMAVVAYGISALISNSKSKVPNQSQSETTKTLRPNLTESSTASAEAQPVLAVEQKVPSTGRPTLETDEGLVYEDFLLDPFDITIDNERHGWTEADGRRPEVMDALAHNDFERERMAEENLWVKRRELVYRKQTLQEMLGKAKAQGEELKSFIFPGFAGKEYEVVVTDAGSEINEDGIPIGWINGHLRDDPQSSASLSYYANREVGSIISQELEIDIGYEPREDDQIIIREADPVAVDYISQDWSCKTTYSSHAVGNPYAFSTQE